MSYEQGLPISEVAASGKTTIINVTESMPEKYCHHNNQSHDAE